MHIRNGNQKKIENVLKLHEVIPVLSILWCLMLEIIITSLCGRDGRTICGPLRQPKSTYVTLAHKRKQKFLYFGCSLVRRFYCKITKLHPLTGRTDRQTDRVRRNMRPPPREEGRIIIIIIIIEFL